MLILLVLSLAHAGSATPTPTISVEATSPPELADPGWGPPPSLPVRVQLPFDIASSWPDDVGLHGVDTAWVDVRSASPDIRLGLADLPQLDRKSALWASKRGELACVLQVRGRRVTGFGYCRHSGARTPGNSVGDYRRAVMSYSLLYGGLFAGGAGLISLGNSTQEPLAVVGGGLMAGTAILSVPGVIAMVVSARRTAKRKQLFESRQTP